MVEKYPTLDNYQDLWPLDVILIGLLKYRSAHGKEIAMKQAAAIIRNG